MLLQTRNLFIPRSDESDKNARNGELRYKKGTKAAFGVTRCCQDSSRALLALRPRKLNDMPAVPFGGVGSRGRPAQSMQSRIP